MLALASCRDGASDESASGIAARRVLEAHGSAGAKAVLEARKGIPSLHAFDELLRAAVKDGRIDFEVVAAKRAVLDETVAAIARVDFEALDAVARAALLVNVFHATVLRRVVERLVVERLDGRAHADVLVADEAFFDEPCVEVFGKRSSLQDLVDRARSFGDPRLHFALYRAARSSPALQPRVFTAEKLEQDLDAATQGFLRDARGLCVTDRRVFVSSLIGRYAQDFGGEEGIKNFLRLHAAAPVKEYLDAKLGYLDYDGRL